MIELANSTDYTNIKPLFEGMYLTLMIDGVMAGSSTGVLWVDDPSHPQTALMWDDAYIFYLVGQADNVAVNQQLGELFTTQLTATARARD